MMEPQVSSNKEEMENQTAVEKSPGQSSASFPLRGGGDGADLSLLPETNGAASSSGRVLRDRSLRSVPGWRQSDIGVEQAEVSQELSGNRRRKAKNPRRRKSAAAAPASSEAGIDSDCDLLEEFEEKQDELSNRAARGRRVQMRSGARTCRGSPRTAFKLEPEMDVDYVEANKAVEKTGTSVKKKEDGNTEEDEVIEEDESPYVDDPKDENYEPLSVSEAEGVVSSEEEVPFRDDLNDESYSPKESPVKSKRRPHTRLKEKTERAAGKETRAEPGLESEIKTEGEESAQLQTAANDPALPKKRGRRRKDDKTPRIPKRRKKPPVQYVRCEMEGCGTVLAHPRYLQHHIKYQHLMKKKYVCPHPTCGRLFRLQKQLLRHAKHHTDQRDYICEFCARAFKSSHNLAVHRMIHTGEKPLQCEICGFTCRQKASLNWHMKKHDADATYQFSCNICGKKFEKKDSVVAHKAKSHPEVLIAEALAANAGGLITTPAGISTLLETSSGSVQTEKMLPKTQGSSAVADSDQCGRSVQVPMSLTMPSNEEDNKNNPPVQQATSFPLQMPLQFPSQHLQKIQPLNLQPLTSSSVSQQTTVVNQMPLQPYSHQSPIVHMNFRAPPQQQQQLPLVPIGQPLQNQTLSRPPSHNLMPNTPMLSQMLPEASSGLGFQRDPASSSMSPQSSMPPDSRQVVWERSGTGENGNVDRNWEAEREREERSMMDSSESQRRRVLM